MVSFAQEGMNKLTRYSDSNCGVIDRMIFRYRSIISYCKRGRHTRRVYDLPSLLSSLTPRLCLVVYSMLQRRICRSVKGSPDIDMTWLAAGRKRRSSSWTMIQAARCHWGGLSGISYCRPSRGRSSLLLKPLLWIIIWLYNLMKGKVINARLQLNVTHSLLSSTPNLLVPVASLYCRSSE